jgi:hypothetical protein
MPGTRGAKYVGECGVLNGLVLNGQTSFVLAEMFLPGRHLELFDEHLGAFPHSVQLPAGCSAAEPGKAQVLHRGEEVGFGVVADVVLDRHHNRPGLRVRLQSDGGRAPVGGGRAVDVLVSGILQKKPPAALTMTSAAARRMAVRSPACWVIRPQIGEAAAWEPRKTTR